MSETPWPLDREALEPHYDRVEPVLAPTPYPTDQEPYASTPKTLAFAEAAERAGLEVDHPPLAITFADESGRTEPGLPLAPDGNLHDRRRYTCRLIGECDVGCNEGAKNTLDYNYLSAAKREGAEIRTCCEAVAVSPAENGYEVRYLQHLSARGDHREDLLDPTDEIDRTVTGKIVVVAAGTFGSNRLLLASRGSLPGLSPALGPQLLQQRRLPVGGPQLQGRRRGLAPPRPEPRTGDHPERPPARGRGGRPADVDPGGRRAGVQRVALARRGGAGGPVGAAGRGRAETEGSPAGPSPHPRQRRSCPGVRERALVGLDDGDAVARLRRARRAAAAARATSSSSTGIPRETRRATTTPRTPWRSAWPTSSGASWDPSALLDRARSAAAHPVGGCAMAEHPRDGVVDTWGEVFGRPGLFVADGSVMPGPVGPNPSFTIAAVADRFAERMIERVEEQP